MIFERQSYLQELISAEGNGMIKIVTGIRRCGKSYLLFNLYRSHLIKLGVSEDHLIQVNLEDRRNKQLRNPDALIEYIDNRMTDNRTYYILLDEIQLVNEFEDVLNSYLSIPNAEVYVTGSNAKFLSNDIITAFRGRGWEIRIHPLSFSEYYDVVGGELSQALENYYLYGGLPAVAQFDSPIMKQDYLREIFKTVYLRDVVERNHLRGGSDGLHELLRILASAMGSSTNVKRIANTFKYEAGIDIGRNTIARYLAHLQDAFLINEALRYDVKGRKYVGTETKYYFEDIGIRNAILDFRQLEFNHTMENVIYNELRRLHYSVDGGRVETFKQNKDGKSVRSNLEIDFVVNRHDERLYIQSAYALPDKEKTEQEQASLMQVNDNFHKVIIVGDRYHSNYNEDGILLLNIYDFLLGKVRL
ncbi:MAG: ATP-binding protein [Bacteroidales bacterium]|nr:ATP-binding protein [Bacteroidales bacterium]